MNWVESEACVGVMEPAVLRRELDESNRLRVADVPVATHEAMDCLYSSRLKRPLKLLAQNTTNHGVVMS